MNAETPRCIGRPTEPSETCVPCLPGSARSFNESKCTTCPIGYVATKTGSAYCELCGVGSHSNIAHTECLVPAAQANCERWTRCPTCKQRWTGVTKLLMARARWGTHIAADTADGDPERLAAALELVQALGESGELDEAAQRGGEALAMARRLHG